MKLQNLIEMFIYNILTVSFTVLWHKNKLKTYGVSFFYFHKVFILIFYAIQHDTHLSNSQHALRFSLQKDTENCTLFNLFLVDDPPSQIELT